MTLPDFWRCRECGCLWRDNHDGSVSLASAKQTSCIDCETFSTAEQCDPLWRDAGEPVDLEVYKRFPRLGQPEIARLIAEVEQLRAALAASRSGETDNGRLTSEEAITVREGLRRAPKTTDAPAEKKA